jgi:hypothetical protein
MPPKAERSGSQAEEFATLVAQEAEQAVVRVEDPVVGVGGHEYGNGTRPEQRVETITRKRGGGAFAHRLLASRLPSRTIHRCLRGRIGRTAFERARIVPLRWATP